MEEKKLVPKRRFEGFDGEWEKEYLGNISDIKTGPFGSSLHAKDYVKSGVPIITTEHFKEGFLPVEAHGLPQVSSEDYSRLSAYRLLKDDIVFSRVGSVDINALTTQNQNLLDTKKVKNDVVTRAVGQTMPSINTEILKRTELTMINAINEQQKIGKFFKVLDERIANQERKIDKVKALKEAYLTEMFPQEDETVPKRRFGEFEGEWVESTIKDTTEINSGMDYKHLKFGNIPVYGTGGYMLSVNDQLSTSDGIGIGRKGTIDKPQFLKAPFWTVDTLFYMIPKKDYDIYYLYYLCNTIKWRKYDESTGVPSLSKDTIGNISIMTPIIEEQQKIGKFFKNLDNQIATEEAKLEKLKKMKAAYLEEMFV
ncbi:restriction endonuclease subunit S [Sporosarcina pasteurii]|uniref:Type I restriction enzyme specificity protein MG438 n=1 Tax=Sporosarcina pasteurii TaxID=1474 RepID=A0A380BL87_SPOPA|nr:restriction endonuclease subunit S [Sporosarcina pasteurii]MDS9470903.1 restriction endonuclease subunit S [Sporosarcina pasteurii]SUJ03226.1 Type I restriction enzyme specificity protein MG438 [Sporosarcina pasteurii]